MGRARAARTGGAGRTLPNGAFRRPSFSRRRDVQVDAGANQAGPRSVRRRHPRRRVVVGRREQIQVYEGPILRRHRRLYHVMECLPAARLPSTGAALGAAGGRANFEPWPSLPAASRRPGASTKSPAGISCATPTARRSRTSIRERTRPRRARRRCSRRRGPPGRQQHRAVAGAARERASAS